MLKCMITVAFLLLLNTFVCSAQSDETGRAVAVGDAAADEPAGKKPEAARSTLDAAEAEYRELICSRAADFEGANQVLAIQLAVRQKFVDSRFDALIRETMKTASKPEHWDIERLTIAEQLLPLCTLSGKERTELVFHCYMMCGDERADQQLERDLKQQLSLYPDETSRLVSERMRQDDYTPRLLSLVLIVGASSDSVLPMVLGAARSDDPQLAGWALVTIPRLIDGLREQEAQQAETQLLRERLLSEMGVEEVDPKMLTYAERIISRYDTNGDDQLTRSEYGKMLMSPAAADADEDGVITVPEYAVWMQLRQRGGRQQ